MDNHSRHHPIDQPRHFEHKEERGLSHISDRRRALHLEPSGGITWAAIITPCLIVDCRELFPSAEPLHAASPALACQRPACHQLATCGSKFFRLCYPGPKHLLVCVTSPPLVSSTGRKKAGRTFAQRADGPSVRSQQILPDLSVSKRRG